MNAAPTNAGIKLTKSNLFSYITEEVATQGVFSEHNRNHYDRSEQYIRLLLPVLPKITTWVNDWVDVFNDTAENAGCVLYAYVDGGDGYIIERIVPGDISYPTADDADEESITITKEQYDDCPDMLKEETDYFNDSESETDTDSGEE